MKKTILVVSALSATALTTQAASIGLNFGAGRANSSLLSTDVAGVVPQDNWNNLSGASGVTVLNGDDGSASGASVTWTTDEEWSVGPTPVDSNGTLLSGFVSENNAVPSTIDITGIPYASYDLIVYVSHDRAFEDVILGEASGAFPDFTAIENDTDLTAPVSFVEQTTSGASSGDYVVFSGLTASSLVLTMSQVDVNFTDGVTTGGTLERNAISGIQIVESTIPEPSSSLMALLALAGFAGRRRR